MYTMPHLQNMCFVPHTGLDITLASWAGSLSQPALKKLCATLLTTKTVRTRSVPTPHGSPRPGQKTGGSSARHYIPHQVAASKGARSGIALAQDALAFILPQLPVLIRLARTRRGAVAQLCIAISRHCCAMPCFELVFRVFSEFGGAVLAEIAPEQPPPTVLISSIFPRDALRLDPEVSGTTAEGAERTISLIAERPFLGIPVDAAALGGFPVLPRRSSSEASLGLPGPLFTRTSGDIST
jgi:hypothetical protein